MKILFSKSFLLQAITPLLNTVSNRSTTPSAEGLLIQASDDNRVVLTTFDNEKGTQTVIDADVQEPGECIIKAYKLSQIVRASEGDTVLIEVDSSLGVQITTGRAKTKMIANSADDFSTIPQLDGENGFVVSQAILKKMFQKVSFAVGINDQRPILNGCFVQVTDGKMLLVASDSFRVARCETDVAIDTIGQNQEFKFIIPGKAVNEFVKLLNDEEDAEARIFLSKKYMVAIVDQFAFFTKLIEGEYLDFDRIIVRSHKIKVRVNRNEMISALERAALVTEEKFNGNELSHVKITIEDQTIKITAMSTISSLYDEVECEHEGEDLIIAFNNKFLLDCIAACNSEKVLISLNSAYSSANVTPDDEDADNDLYMVLPMKMAG